MTIQELLDLNDDQLLAALQGALERAEADERDATARVAKYARALAAFGDEAPTPIRVEKISGHVGMPPLPPAATPKSVGPRGKPRGGDAPASRSHAKKPCDECGTMVAPQGLPGHKRKHHGAPPKATALRLAAVPDPTPTGTPESRHPSTATGPSGGHFECSSCRLTFGEVAELSRHTITTHGREPRQAERIAIPA